MMRDHSTRDLLLILLVTVSVAGAQSEPPQDIPDEIVQKVDPSVVAIQHERAVGSGFVVSKDGYILTNGHVVRGNDAEDPTEPAKSITVVLNDERKYPAHVLGFCMNPDVALIKIDPETPLQPVEIGDSQACQIGQKCFAVGTPSGLKRTFTSGILSNVDRSDLNTFTKVLQTDAAINPGNSGGPLFDRNGRVLGINTYASAGRNNLGFTIPIHVARVLKDHFMQHGRFVRADIPTFYVSELYDEMREALGVETGLLVDFVMAGTPAETFGLRAGDILVAIDGKPCSAFTQAEKLDVQWEFSIREPGSSVELTVLRGPHDKRERVTLSGTVLEADPDINTGRFPGEIKKHRYDALGLTFKKIVRDHRLMHRLADDPGVLLESAAKDSPAEKAGIAKNDIVTHVEGTQVTDLTSFQHEIELQLAKRAKAIDLTLRRRKNSFRTSIKPDYDMKGDRIAVLVPPGEPSYLELMLREMVAQGAEIALVSLDGTATCSNIVVASTAALSEVKGSDLDALVIADSDDAKALWSDEDALRLVREVNDAEGTLAAVGASAITLLAAVPELKEKKITTSKATSGAAMQREATYTGSDVERDGNVITTTGFERKVIRDFLKQLGKMRWSAD